MRRFTVFLLALAALAQTPAPEIKLPLQPKSVRFAVIGDSGTGGPEQYAVGQQMEKFRGLVSFDFVIMLGDNMYGGQSADDYKVKFENPYKPLLDAGVKFYAALGNHDDPNQRFYKPFNMGGKRFYNFKNGNVEFFALDSNYMDPEQLDWVAKQLRASSAAWKICFFHHPLYSHAKFHGSDTDLRKRLEPIFQQSGVSVVFAGHEHVYERLKPQNGINYFVLGNSGQLRFRDLKPSPDTAKGFDTDRTFSMVEVAGDQLYFQTISRTGDTVDSGVIERTKTMISAAVGRTPRSAAGPPRPALLGPRSLKPPPPTHSPSTPLTPARQPRPPLLPARSASSRSQTNPSSAPRPPAQSRYPTPAATRSPHAPIAPESTG
jgi:predicted phosphodiesterase